MTNECDICNRRHTRLSNYGKNVRVCDTCGQHACDMHSTPNTNNQYCWCLDCEEREYPDEETGMITSYDDLFDEMNLAAQSDIEAVC